MFRLLKSTISKLFPYALSALFLLTSHRINAQSVGIGTDKPDSSAMLDVTSTNKGFLPPRMTEAQRNAIVSPAPGLMMWCTDCGLSGELMVFNGAGWTKPTPREGKNYYVSSSGDDVENDGLSSLQPWRTLAKVNSEMPSMSPGDSILFKRGDYFFGTMTMVRSGTAQNPIVFGAYGPETDWKPILFDRLTVWPEDPGLNSVWKDLGSHIWSYKDNVMNDKKVDIANLVLLVKDSNKDTFGVKKMFANPDSLSAQGEFLYDYNNNRLLLYSAVRPIDFYSSIQLVLSENAIYFPKNVNSYVIFDNLDFRYYGKCVVEESGNYCSFRNLDIHYIGGGDHCNPDSVKDRYQERYGNGLQIWNANDHPSSHDITITGCWVDNVYDAGISPQGLSTEPYSVYNIYVWNNVITNCEYSFEFFERTILDIYTIKPRPHNENINTHDIYFENNTCANAGGGWSHNQRFSSHVNPHELKNGSHLRLEAFDGTKSNIFIRNNIYYGATEQLNWILFPDDIGNFILDYNDFYQTKIPIPPDSTKEPIGEKFTNSRFYTLIDWQDTLYKLTNVQLEKNSYDNINPLFVSPTDFHLQPGSALIGKGIDLGYGKYMGAYPYVDSGN